MINIIEPFAWKCDSVKTQIYIVNLKYSHVLASITNEMIFLFKVLFQLFHNGGKYVCKWISCKYMCIREKYYLTGFK